MNYQPLLISFVACCVSTALYSGCGVDPEVQTEKEAVRKTLTLSIVQQLPVQQNAAAPVAAAGGVVMADGAGKVIRLDLQLHTLWSVTLDGSEFTNSGTPLAGHLYLCSSEGKVFCLSLDDGSRIWTKSLDAAFVHAPLLRQDPAQTRLWLLSADDGCLYCLDAQSGAQLWKSDETNRSDGGAVLWSNKLVYGNCDGAAHIFDSSIGSEIESVPVGDSDQMAGTPVVRDDGFLFIGTRQGNLAVINLPSQKLLSTLKLSEEEAFTVPVLAFGSTVAMGTNEGDIFLCDLKNGGLLTVRKKAQTEASVEYLSFDGSLLYAVSGGNLLAFNENLEVESSINAGDDVYGLSALGDGLYAVLADRSLLLIKGEWK